MAEKTHAIKIAEGPITVVYRQEDGEWYCTALEFDLLGSGTTRAAALAELKELVNLYLVEVLKAKAKGKVAFFNPSNAEEWDNPDRERYEVSVILLQKKAELPTAKVLPLDDIKPLLRDVREFEMKPLCA